MEKEDQFSETMAGPLGVNPFIDHNSSSRTNMFGAHIAQRLVVQNMTENALQTGANVELGNYTFSVKVPFDCKVLAIINKYKPMNNNFTWENSPKKIVIIESIHTLEISYIELPKYCSYHAHFGFKYIGQRGLEELATGATLREGTTLLDSPGKASNGNYMFGREINVAFMSHPGCSEDGVVVSESLLDKFTFNTYEKVKVNFGRDYFPVNIYGDDDVYRGFPDIGDMVRPDGLLVALRKYNDFFMPIKQSKYAVSTIDEIFDRRIYTNGDNGRIIDIEVYTCGDRKQEFTPMDRQLQQYVYGTKVFYQEIMDVYKRIAKEHEKRGTVPTLSPKFHSLIQECFIALYEYESRAKIDKTYRKEPLDGYMAIFTIEYAVKPTKGMKFTDMHGGKGVVVHVMPDDHMPVDSEGNRADYIMDPNSRINRMNLGGLYELYINSASRDVAKRIRKSLNIDHGDSGSLDKVKAIYGSNKALFDEVWNYLVGYYQLICPKLFEWSHTMADEEKIDVLAGICHDKIYLYLPLGEGIEYDKAVKAIESNPAYKPLYGPVSYRGYSGELKTTKENIRIGGMYIMILDKIGDDGSSVSVGKLQNFGVLAKLTKESKNDEPFRAQPIRGMGETETRILTAYTPPDVITELMDRSNNPSTAESMVETILSAPKPTNIKKLINRKVETYGNTKPLQIFNHILMCMGTELMYEQKTPGAMPK